MDLNDPGVAWEAECWYLTLDVMHKHTPEETFRAAECTGKIPPGEPHHRKDGMFLDVVKNDESHPRNRPRVCRHCVRHSNWSAARGHGGYENKKILTRVELTYSDGTRRVLDGEDALRWDEATSAVSVSAWAHGVEVPPLKWRDE